MARQTTKAAKPTPTNPKYPAIHVRFTGQNGNAFNLIAICTRAAKDCDLPRSEIAAFQAEVLAAEDYDGVIQTAMRWFRVS